MELFTDIKSRLAFRSGGKAEQERTESPWERLARSGRALVATIERSGKIREANEALCKLREEDREDVVGTSLLYLVHAEDRTSFSEMLREVFGGAGSGAGSGRILAPGDRKPPVHWILLPCPAVEGRLETVSVLGVLLDEDPGAGERNAELAALHQTLSDLKRETVGLHKEKAELELKLTEPPAPAPAPSVDPGPIPGLEDDEPTPTLAELERRYILHVLDQTKGRISGARGAAAVLGLHPNTLRSRMQKHGIGKGGWGASVLQTKPGE